MLTLTDFRSRFQKGWKSVWNDIGFALDADSGLGNSRYSGRRYHVPGTSMSWDYAAGDLLACPAVAACQNWVNRNLPQAPPQVMRRNTQGEETPRPDHPLTELLTNPNELYDYTCLMMGTLQSGFLDGNSYWAIERGSYNQPIELWWLPARCITPRRSRNSRSPLPDYYEYRVGSQTQRLKTQDVVHIRFGIDPYNYMLGMSPLASVSRDVYTLQQAINYTARMLKNSGLVGVLATPKDANYVFDVDDFVARWQNKVTGDQQGEAIAYDVPIDIQFPSFTPQNMALDTVPDRSEAVVCALYCIPPSVCGLHVGRLFRTDANMEQSRQIAWEENGIPTLLAIGSQGGRQLLPQLSPKSRTERLSFDFSQIRPLQPDLDALHARTANNWKLGLIDRAEWKREVGLKPDPEKDEGLYYYDLFPAISGEIPDGGASTMPTGATGAQNGAEAARTRSERNGAERVTAA